MASPDINTEDFMAAVDCLGLRAEVDRDRIGMIGICGFGGLALNAAAPDKRVKAVAVTSMYDTSRVNARGYYDAMTDEQRAETLARLSQQRWDDAASGAAPAVAGGLSALKTDDWHQMVDVNIKGVLNGVASVLPIFTAQKRGQVIATSSVAGLKAYPGGAVYGGTKWFVRDFMEVLRMEAGFEGTDLPRDFSSTVD